MDFKLEAIIKSDFFSAMFTLLKQRKKIFVEYPKAAYSKHFAKLRSFQKNSVTVKNPG